jgi:hypothetical protein
MPDFGGINTLAQPDPTDSPAVRLVHRATLIVTLVFRGLNELDFASKRFRRFVERLTESIGMNKLADPMFAKLDELGGLHRAAFWRAFSADGDLHNGASHQSRRSASERLIQDRERSWLQLFKLGLARFRQSKRLGPPPR